MRSKSITTVSLLLSIWCGVAATQAKDRAGGPRGEEDCLAGTTPNCAQPPAGEDGLSFRADPWFPTGDDFICSTNDPIVAVRWWGTISDETTPHDTSATVPFDISFYSSTGSLPQAVLASHTVDAIETWTGGYCRGIEGGGGGDECLGLEPLYMYEACIDPPFMPEAGTEYWLVIHNLVDAEPTFWAIHEAGVSHPTGNEAATYGFSGFEAGVINACPGDFGSVVGPYDLAYELLIEGAPAIPAASTRGMVILILLLMVSASIVLRRRPPVEAPG